MEHIRSTGLIRVKQTKITELIFEQNFEVETVVNQNRIN